VAAISFEVHKEYESFKGLSAENTCLSTYSDPQTTHFFLRRILEREKSNKKS